VFFELLLCPLNNCYVLWRTSLCFHVIWRVCLRPPFMFIALFCIERRNVFSIQLYWQ
jgi:hypothetical protein